VYQVLYRKWRPRVFSDVVGQEHITDTLLSQIKENRVAHAYLFTGSRGTGKTTCAKIFAKTLNCLAPVNGEPCNCCEICKSIDNGSNLDIVEMDAASNRGIDDIRKLLEEVSYPPSRSKYRVYIIDEVHMMTKEAFNALLKTLEEPPDYVRFVLATTDVQKMPTTIVSRCQRFDFRRIEPEVIADRLSYIAEAEGGHIDHDAGEYIAKIADGGMRDSLSLLDRCLSLTNNVTSEIVADSAGLIGREYLYDILRAVGRHDTAACLNILDDLHRKSCDTERLCGDLIECFRNFLVLKTVEHPEKLIVCTKKELETIREVAEFFSDEYVVFALGILADVAETMKYSASRRIEAEMAFIRLCRPESAGGIEALTARINQLENEIAALKRNGIAVSVQSQPDLTPASVSTVNNTVSAAPQNTVKASVPPVQEKTGPVFSRPADMPEEKTATPDASPFGGFASAISGGTSVFDTPEDDEDDEPYVFDDNPLNEGSSGIYDESAGYESDDVPFDEDDFPPPDDADIPADSGFVPPVPEDNDNKPSGNGSFDFDKFMKDNSSAAQKAEQTTAPPAQKNASAKELDRKTWLSVVREAESRNNALISHLSNTTATMVGDSIRVKMTSRLLPESIIVSALEKAAEAVLGRKFNITIQR